MAAAKEAQNAVPEEITIRDPYLDNKFQGYCNCSKYRIDWDDKEQIKLYEEFIYRDKNKLAIDYFNLNDDEVITNFLKS